MIADRNSHSRSNARPRNVVPESCNAAKAQKLFVAGCSRANHFAMFRQGSVVSLRYSGTQYGTTVQVTGISSIGSRFQSFVSQRGRRGALPRSLPPHGEQNHRNKWARIEVKTSDLLIVYDVLHTLEVPEPFFLSNRMHSVRAKQLLQMQELGPVNPPIFGRLLLAFFSAKGQGRAQHFFA